MAKSEVLIVGAGPTGLVLALWLSRLGVRVRLVDKAATPGQTSRALAVQARTLELYAQLGLAGAVVDRGLPFVAANLWALGKHEARVEFGAMGKGLSPFPFILVYPQDEHERLLTEQLARAGVEVERPMEVVAVESPEDGVTARLRRPDGSIEVCETDYLAACDGARSFVRESLGIDFPGGTYDHLFYVADVEASGPTMNGELHAALDDADFLAVFPLRDPSRARLIGTVRKEAEREGETLGWDHVNKRVLERIRLEIRRVNWFSTYRVHHRVASAFRLGRVFLLGDAAHIHSPVGGQGMNTGIGDAVNFAWKLAATLRGRAHGTILDSYAEERRPFAERLVNTTDRAFEFVSASGPVANKVRIDVVPHVLTTLFHSAKVRRLLFDTVSQIHVRYRRSRLSEGRAGRVHGGDRLPWVPGDMGAGNFEPLTSLEWQAHVYGEATGELRKACAVRDIPLHVFPWEARAKSAGLARDACYLVRPDGYVALATSASHAIDDLARYLSGRSLRCARR